MRKSALLMVLLLGAAWFPASADPIKTTFAGGILGIPWGTTLTGLVGTYPQGDHMFADTPGCRAYWVKDGQQFLGIPREGRGVLYGLDEQNRVAVVAVAFDFERKEELRTTLTSLLGPPTLNIQSAQKIQYGWRSPDGMSARVREFGNGLQRMVWLSVAIPGYKPATGC
jgi:hypothetical protein